MRQPRSAKARSVEPLGNRRCAASAEIRALTPILIEEFWIGVHPFRPVASRRSSDVIGIAYGGGVQLQAQSARPGPRSPHPILTERTRKRVRIIDESDAGDFQTTSLSIRRLDVVRDQRKPGRVPARVRQAGDQAFFNGAAGGSEYDGNRCACLLCRQRRRRSAGDNELYAGADQVRRQFRHPFGLEFRPAIFDDEVLPLDITALAHSFEKAPGKNARTGSGGQPADPPDAIGFLPAHRVRPRRC